MNARGKKPLLKLLAPIRTGFFILTLRADAA